MQMLCRCVFAFWWSIFVLAVWRHIRPPNLQQWSVDKHTTTAILTSNTFTPLQFENASILWLDSLTDTITIDLVQTIPLAMGVVSVKKAVMNVYETDSRTTMMEKYSITCD